MKSALRGIALLSFAVVASSAQAQLESQLGILDLTANDGINPATGVAWADGDNYRLAFITTGTIDATSADISTYNAFVQNAAANSLTFSNLGDVDWSVIASTDSINARDNTSTDPTTDGTGEATFLLDGTSIFAADYADLWDSANNNPTVRIDRTENGDKRAPNYPGTPIWTPWTAVWTGTNNDGSQAGASVLGRADGDVRHGLMAAENNFWLSRSSNDPATYSLPIYGLSEVLTVTDASGGPTPLAGDFNGDGTVDAADYTLYADNLGQIDESAFAPGTGDGMNGVDPGDYNLWRDNFGQSAPPLLGGGGGAVPEPGTIALLASGLGLGMIALRNRRK